MLGVIKAKAEKFVEVLGGKVSVSSPATGIHEIVCYLENKVVLTVVHEYMPKKRTLLIRRRYLDGEMIELELDEDVGLELEIDCDAVVNNCKSWSWGHGMSMIISVKTDCIQFIVAEGDDKKLIRVEIS